MSEVFSQGESLRDEANLSTKLQRVEGKTMSSRAKEWLDVLRGYEV